MGYDIVMTAVPFDTLKLARRLETAGLEPRVAAGTSEALADAMSGAALATKDDLKDQIAPVRTEIAAVRAELRSEIASVRSDLRTEIASVRADLKAEATAIRTEIATLEHSVGVRFDGVRADMEILRRDMTIRMGSMMMLAVGVLLTAIRFLPPHP